MSIVESPKDFITDEQIEKALSAEAYELNLPVSVYDIEIASANGDKKNVFADLKGKVTLLFNVAAGCGNIPQHGNLEKLNQMYKNESDFNILAVVVDDFTCHGYPQFQDGIDKYIEKNNLDLTPGQVAQKYAQDHFNTTYEFTELTNGRHDKHTYDSNYAPGSVKQQDQHILWSYLTNAYDADIMENGIPYHNEEVPWSSAKAPSVEGKRYFMPLTGNFTKFLIDRTGTKVKRYSNGFMLGERGIDGTTFPWYPEKFQEDGRRNHNPATGDNPVEGFPAGGPYPNPLQSFGIDISLQIISRDIDNYLNNS